MPPVDYFEMDVTGMSATAVCDLIDERLNHPRGLYKRIDFVQEVSDAGQKQLLMRTWKTPVDFSKYVCRRERRT